MSLVSSFINGRSLPLVLHDLPHAHHITCIDAQVCFDPSGIVAPVSMAPERFAPVKSAPVKFAPVRFVPVRSAPARFALLVDLWPENHALVTEEAVPLSENHGLAVPVSSESLDALLLKTFYSIFNCHSI
jgi:hypothetical protein